MFYFAVFYVVIDSTYKCIISKLTDSQSSNLHSKCIWCVQLTASLLVWPFFKVVGQYVKIHILNQIGAQKSQSMHTSTC